MGRRVGSAPCLGATGEEILMRRLPERADGKRMEALSGTSRIVYHKHVHVVV